MIAVRQIQEVIAGTVTITLPMQFEARRVEVIVLPVEGEVSETGQLGHLLLSAPTLSEDELHGFTQVKDWMSQWAVNEFC
jgi:hypothetical protein